MMKRDAPAQPDEKIALEFRVDRGCPEYADAVPDGSKAYSVREIGKQPAGWRLTAAALMHPDNPVILEVVKDRERRQDRQHIFERGEDREVERDHDPKQQMLGAGTQRFDGLREEGLEQYRRGNDEC